MCWFREVYYFTFLRSGQKKKRLTASNVEAFIDRNSSRTLQDALAERLKTRELRYPSSLPRTCRIQTESVRGKLHVSPRARTRRAIGPRQDYQESYESNLARRCIPRGAPRGGTSYPSSESGTRTLLVIPRARHRAHLTLHHAVLSPHERTNTPRVPSRAYAIST